MKTAKKILIAGLFMLLLQISAMMFSYGQTIKPVKIIFDTDMGPDYDDVGALAMLHALADQGEAELLATIASTRYEGVAAILEIINNYFNRPSVPIGVAGPYGLLLKDWQHWTDSLLHHFPHTIRTNAEVPSAVQLYRQVLARQEGQSVTLVTVGFLSNIAALLESEPDEYSHLSGRDLINEKVKQMVSMAGKFPSGKEYNIEQDTTAAKAVAFNFPRPVIFCGFEIGEKIKTGLPLLEKSYAPKSPVRMAYSISIPKDTGDKDGRMSWDQTAVWVAVKGPEPDFVLQKGKIIIEEDGSNAWQNKHDTIPHYFIKTKTSPDILQLKFDKLMMHQPLN